MGLKELLDGNPDLKAIVERYESNRKTYYDDSERNNSDDLGDDDLDYLKIKERFNL